MDVWQKLSTTSSGLRLAPIGGLAIHWLWVYIAMLDTSRVLYHGIELGESTVLFISGVFGGVVVCAVVLSTVLGTCDPAHKGKRVAWSSIGAACRVLGVMLLLGFSHVVAPAALLVLSCCSGFVCGVGSCLLLIGWERVVGCYNNSSARVVVALGFAIALLLAFLLEWASSAWGWRLGAVALASPALDGVLLALSLRSASDYQLPSDGSTPALSLESESRGRTIILVVRAGVPFVLFGYTLSALREMSVHTLIQWDFGVTALVGVVFVLVVATLLVFLTSSFVRGVGFELTVAALVVASVALMLVFFENAGGPVYLSLELLGYFFLEVAIWTSVSRLSWFGRNWLLRRCGLFVAALFIGQFACPIVNRFAGLREASTLENTVEPIALMFILLVAVFLLSGDRFSRAVGGPRHADATDETAGAGQTIRPVDGVDRLASRFALSARETEVVRMMSEGHNIASIGERLGVSESTARTYVRRVYSKTDVHARQELIELLEEFASEEPNVSGGRFF